MIIVRDVTCGEKLIKIFKKKFNGRPHRKRLIGNSFERKNNTMAAKKKAAKKATKKKATKKRA